MRRWRIFRKPFSILQAKTCQELPELLHQIDQARRTGSWVVGFVSYEAAGAFDRAFPPPHPHRDLPLAWFAFFDQAENSSFPSCLSERSQPSWTTGLDPQSYQDKARKILDWIAAGDCYQTNFTFPMHAHIEGNIWPLFTQWIHAQQCRYGGLIHTGGHILASASPELFFRREGSCLTCRPMKGTTSRMPGSEADQKQSDWLHHSAKNRAENVMIVDMIRNDLGRIAKPGSIRTSRLFEIETYPTVHQMTSTVQAESSASLAEIFSALFPCASVTGAPKKRCLDIIRSLESTPRDVYTGAIGWIAPDGFSQFNVAIRTAQIRVKDGHATFGTGSGIVADSDPHEEYRECLDKAAFMQHAPPPFALLETLKGSASEGFFLLDEHLQRMEASAHYFSYPWNAKQLRRALLGGLDPKGSIMRFRVLLHEDGAVEIQTSPFSAQKEPRWKVRLATHPVNSGDPFLSHKTTHRLVYDQHLQQHADCDDVILFNEKGELTESCLANLVLDIDGHLVTPPLCCGLLNGTFRNHLLRKGPLEERVLFPEDLARARTIRLINSVRGWIKVDWIQK